MMEEIWRRANEPAVVTAFEKPVEVEPEKRLVLEFRDDWREQLLQEASDEIGFVDRVLGSDEFQGRVMLSLALRDLSIEELQEHFVEFMARDLDDSQAVEYAGTVLMEIAKRSPKLGVGLLSAMTPAEKESLVPSVARGWTLNDPAGAFEWIEVAWVEEDGGYIDRGLQNQLYESAMYTLTGMLRQYDVAAETLAGIVDPALKSELTDLVAYVMVRDGPERAMDSLVNLETAIFDTSVMDAVADQWAARDSVGAADWVLANETEMSSTGVRSIAKHLALGEQAEALTGFHSGLLEIGKRDTVASEVARLKARREPEDSARWAQAIENPDRRQRAVFDALYEIGYDDFDSSLGYIDRVYTVEDAARSPVVYSTLKDWLAVDLDAVAGYLGSGRANLSASLSEELLLEMEQLPRG